MSAVIEQLAEMQDSIRDLGAQLDEPDYRAQFHEDLSPLGWHVGHCSFIETYWLREIAMHDDSLTGALHNLYFPENIPKPQRGPALPQPDQHLAWCQRLNNDNRALLSNPPAVLRQNKLSENDYLGIFIVQHHAQHLETMYMVLQQRAIKRGTDNFQVGNPLIADHALPATVRLQSGHYRIGNEYGPEAFDNELPPHDVELQATNIARTPVSNANWLAFMEDSGYSTKQWWSDDGMAWLEQQHALCPEHWQQDENNNWFGLDHNGPHELVTTEPVCGINYYEAQAYTKWLASKHNAKIRPIHEYEWEAAVKQQLLDATAVVWEWCENTFHGYDGFKAFPYDNYSKAWFDNKHYVLRGASRQTCDIIKRPSFRNFYNPDKRHIFAGLRIVID